MDPKIRWRAHDPQLVGCEDRDDVMEIVGERFQQGFTRGDLEFIDTSGEKIIGCLAPGDRWRVGLA